MLLRFADGQPETLGALRAAVAAGDAAAASRHAHAIAGAAGNLGADALCAAAKSLEQAGREQQRPRLAPLLAVVEERAAVVLRSIETLRPSADGLVARVNGPFAAASAGAALDRLMVALENSDATSASRALNDLDSFGFPPWAADDLGRLRHCVDGYEYGTARGIASGLVARVQHHAP